MNPMNLFLTVVAAGTLTVGCASPDPPKTPAETGAATSSPEMTNEEAAKIAEKDPNKGNVQIGAKLAKLCGIVEADAYFPFDSAVLTPQAKKSLTSLVECFVSGAAKAESLRIVGHADPRGETDYNFGLGQKRAGSVAGQLTKLGLAESRMETSSRGELDATGEDEAGWAKDRKVELLLAD